MAIPLLDYPPISQNQRVSSYEVSGEEASFDFTTQISLSSLQIDSVIGAAYRQIFNEQQMLKSNRLKALESQLRNGQITVRDFIRGLLLSESFRRRNYEVSNNYRFVQMCVQRVLGRNVYGGSEKYAWSIIIATKGLQGFVDDLLNSEEYLENFGFDTVPYQRRRILPQHPQGELAFAQMPRYGVAHRIQLEEMGYFAPMRPDYRWDLQKPPYPPLVQLAGKVILFGGAGVLTFGVIAVALAAWGVITL